MTIKPKRLTGRSFGTRREWRKGRNRWRLKRALYWAFYGNMRGKLYPYQRAFFDAMMRGDKLAPPFRMPSGRLLPAYPDMQYLNPSRLRRIGAPERKLTIQYVDYSEIEARILADLSRKSDSS